MLILAIPSYLLEDSVVRIVLLRHSAGLTIWLFFFLSGTLGLTMGVSQIIDFISNASIIWIHEMYVST